ncbi:MAG TPA: glycosyltransferase [Roseiarcus sp.]|nr:glycosyltransferase [Roseiarcus sp.]
MPPFNLSELDDLVGDGAAMTAPESDGPPPAAPASARPTAPASARPTAPVSAPPAGPASARPAAPVIKAFFDAVNEGRAKGWAFDPLAPDKKVKVEIWIDGAFAAVGEANLFREDLLKAGFGDGSVHFSIALPDRIYDGAEHLVSARIAGATESFGPQIATTLARAAMSVRIDALEGTALRGEAESHFDDWHSVDIFADNEKIGALSLAPDSREAVQCELPAAVLDGNVHWFQFRRSEDGRLVGEFVAATPYVSTPEAVLQRYAREFPSALSANAARRYKALAKQLELAPKFVAGQLAAADSFALPDYIAQVARAHKQVLFGVNDRPGKPEPLTVLEYKTPRVSIVVPAHNKFWVTYNCVAALILAANEVTAEIIIVDDGSTDQTAEIERYIKGVTIVRHETAQGFVRASNGGAEFARGEFIVMLNNDTEPAAGWLDELLYVFERFSDVGMVGAKLVYPDGKLQEAGGLIFQNLDVWNYGRNGNPHDPRFNYIRQVDYCSGACLMLRREVWQQLRGFDEFYAPAYYEDTDLAFRVRALGLKTYYTPFAEIVHFEGVSNGASTASGVKRYQAVNEPKFRSRWAPTIRQKPKGLAPDLAKDSGAMLRALVIDAETPQPDRDAGGYAAIQEMRLMQSLGVKLSFIPENLAYLGNYTEALQRVGVECLYAPYETSIEGLIASRGADFDFFYITRYSVAIRYIDAIRAAAPQAKIVFCNADLHFLREVRAAMASRDPAMMAKASETRELELDVIRRADVTLSYTETEAAVIVSHNFDAGRVMRCPWVVAPTPGAPSFEAREGLAFLGNFRHPPNEEAMVYFLKDVMPGLRERLPNVKLHIFGSHMTDRLKAMAAPDVVIEGFVERVEEVYDRCRVFVAPLRSGAGIKGKVIGALAAGTPSVVSPLAAEGVGISAGVQAMLAETPAEWVSAIAALYSDERRWAEMSERARAFVATNFSFEQGQMRMRAALAAAGVYTQ